MGRWESPGSMNVNTTEHPRTWNPWPVAIIAFFAIFITCVVVFIIFAARQRMDLVRPDYYEDEMRFQSQLDRLNRTLTVNAGVKVAFDARQQLITIELPREQAGAQPSGRIQFYRPSNASLDRNVPLAVNGDGVQRVDAKILPAGLWKVRVQWMVNGEDYFVDRVIVVERHNS